MTSGGIIDDRILILVIYTFIIDLPAGQEVKYNTFKKKMGAVIFFLFLFVSKKLKLIEIEGHIDQKSNTCYYFELCVHQGIP